MLSASGLSPLHFQVYYQWQGRCTDSTNVMYLINLLIPKFHCNAERTASVEHTTYYQEKMQQRTAKEKKTLQSETVG